MLPTPLKEPDAVDVAAIELPQRFGDPGGALAEVGALLGSGALRGVDLALLPEAILTGHVSPRGEFDLRPFAEPLDGPTAGALAGLARRHGLALAGPLIEAAAGHHYNSMLLFDRGGALARPGEPREQTARDCTRIRDAPRVRDVARPGQS
ncbi:MAG: carbon-nitrogen hydrolase family protein [Polyangiaceae bacterium]|nr:carbon-nitrogen hydrolase family protein [Polyangiaceae bacterium]